MVRVGITANSAKLVGVLVRKPERIAVVAIRLTGEPCLNVPKSAPPLNPAPPTSGVPPMTTASRSALLRQSGILLMYKWKKRFRIDPQRKPQLLASG